MGIVRRLAFAVISLAVLFAIFLAISEKYYPDDSMEYCDFLKEKAKTPMVQTYVRDWVSSNIADEQFSIDHPRLHGAGGMWPGNYWLDFQIDWSKFEFDRTRAQVRLVGRLENINAVFFGERSRYGILVRIGESVSFGVKDAKIAWKSGDIAVVCWAGG